MGIQRFFTKSFTITRMVWTNESSSEISQGTVKGHLQQLIDDETQHLGLAFTKSFRLWCSVDSDIQEGDTIDDGLDTYSVKAINKRNYAVGSLNQHLEVFIERDERISV